jgi:protein tyrosine phosphatase (PTP) superfamily phosphohydrolase (DUF442 family)
MSSQLDEIISYVEWEPLLSSSGQPTLEQLEAVVQAEFEVVVNLLPEERVLEGEPDLLLSKGVEYVSIPVVWDSPQRHDIEQFFVTLTALKSRKVFVHCAANMRATAFMYLYYVLEEGRDEAEVRAVMNRVWEPNSVWQQFIEQVLQNPPEKNATGF